MLGATDPDAGPAVAVVVPTRDRPDLLARLLAGLRRQGPGTPSFEVVVCDDASRDGAVEGVLRRAGAGLDLRVLRHETPRGPAVARNAGWRAARAPLVAFLDDDCVPTPGWLGALVAAGGPDRVVQGRVEPDPVDYPRRYGPFSTTLWVKGLTPRFETANIGYPRALLERLGGFDERHVIAAEDTDLGWRAVEAGAQVVFAADALVHHAVLQHGPWRRLVKGWRWRYVPAAYRRHPGLRRDLVLGVFWNDHHAYAVRALVAVALRPTGGRGRRATAAPRGSRPAAASGSSAGRRRGPAWAFVRWWLAMPYVLHLVDHRTGPLLAPYRVACDAVELVAIGVGAIRHRVPMI